MSFAAEYLASLERFAERSSVPRVRALHLPPPRDSDVCDNRGEFCALELEDGSLGLSFVLMENTLERLRARRDGLGLAGSHALALARRYATDEGEVRALGFAAANALTRCFFDRAEYLPDASADSIGALDPQAGERIGMIGLFTPMLARILRSGAELVVVELKAQLAGEKEGYRVTLDPRELESCAKVVSTSTLLLNDTLDAMLAHCRAARWFAMVGPSAGCLPDALFARGVTLLGGSWVLDPEGFLDALRRGEPHTRYTHKFGIAAAEYPGFERLLARV
ncbi:MAG: hypothetical protein HYY28_05215 [Betaproteobacteria bacterium]|nr:hypothetical protein [Betaproteobacteria bacterium]